MYKIYVWGSIVGLLAKGCGYQDNSINHGDLVRPRFGDNQITVVPTEDLMLNILSIRQYLNQTYWITIEFCACHQSFSDAVTDDNVIQTMKVLIVNVGIDIFWYILLQQKLNLHSKGCIGSGDGLAPKGWQAITWTNADLVHWRIYAALGGDEF